MIEEFDDVMTYIADQLGNYETHNEEIDDCNCRTCFTYSLSLRIRKALRVEKRLEPKRSLHRSYIRRNPNLEGSSLRELHAAMTGYFKVMTENEEKKNPSAWVPIVPTKVDAEFQDEKEETNESMRNVQGTNSDGPDETK